MSKSNSKKQPNIVRETGFTYEDYANLDDASFTMNEIMARIPDIQ